MNEGVDVRQLIGARVCVAGAIAVALGGILVGCTAKGVKILDDDRSQIIVRGGSAIFEDGTGSKASDWGPGNPHDPNDRKKWRSTQANGAPVNTYGVTVQRPAQAPGQPSNPCPAVPFEGSLVTIDYTINGRTEHFTFSIDTSGSSGRGEPLLTSTVDLDQSPSNKSQLTYQPAGGGWISQVTVTDGSQSQSCSFADPSGGSTTKAIITIQPRR